MLLAVVMLKAVVEMALLLYVAQAAIRLMSFGRHEANPVYRGVRFLTMPLTGVASRIGATAPRAALVGFGLGCLLWIVLVLAKRALHPALPG